MEEQEIVNELLDAGAPQQAVAAFLNDHLTRQGEVIGETHEGFNQQNVSTWVRGGYQRHLARGLLARSAAERSVTIEGVTHRALALIERRIAELELSKTLDNCDSTLVSLVGEIASIRRCDASEKWLAHDLERIALARARNEQVVRKLSTQAELNELKLSPPHDPDAERIREGGIRILDEMLPKDLRKNKASLLTHPPMEATGEGESSAETFNRV